MRLSLIDVQAWAEGTKLVLENIEPGLGSQIEDGIVGALMAAYDTSSWVDSSSTPTLVRKIIAMQYVAWIIERTYSEDEELNPYGILLMQESSKLIDGLVAGTISIPGLANGVAQGLGNASFYPTDDSSMQCPTPDDYSLGPNKFSMGMRF